MLSTPWHIMEWAKLIQYRLKRVLISRHTYTRRTYFCSTLDYDFKPEVLCIAVLTI